MVGREDRKPGDAVDMKLPHDGGAVGLDRSHASSEDDGDFLGALALGDELQDFALARREAIERASRRIAGALRDSRHEMPRDLRAEIELAVDGPAVPLSSHVGI